MPAANLVTGPHPRGGLPAGHAPRPTLVDPSAYRSLQLGQVFQQAGDFDIIHSHIDHVGFPLAWANRWLVVTTMHGRLDIPELRPLLAAFPELHLISISQSQRAPVLDLDLNSLDRL